MGDMNAVVGEGRNGKKVGDYGLGKRNERGQALVKFCKQSKMVVTNTWFQHEKRGTYTWKRPGDTGRFKIDYILVKPRSKKGKEHGKYSAIRKQEEQKSLASQTR